MHVVGTAGHVDHGKSALVTALTGTNPDRWAQERLRGMTLDLGFAHLVLEGGLEAGIVDVPGHERFLHNMLAGAAGMELLLLVVDAVEGVMPQTVEHLEILTYLNVCRTIVVLTKRDLVPEDELAGARTRIARDLRGSLAEGATTVAVSSVTGEGIAELRQEIAGALRALAPRDARAPVYLPIDRVFTLAGIGTVVTGTLMQGSIAAGDRLTLAPSGMPARVRAIQVFGAARKRVEAGARVALNLPGIDRREIARGAVAASPEFSARSNFRVRFTPMREALALLRRRTPVRAYLGAAEILGTLVFEHPPNAVEPVDAELRLRASTIAFPGVRFVVRRVSPKTLIGGGAIEGEAQPSEEERADPAVAAVLAALRTHGLEGAASDAIALGANLREDAARAALDALAERDAAIALHGPAAYVDADAARAMLERALECAGAAHRAQPWALGLTSIALARALSVPEPLLVRLLGHFAQRGAIAHRSGYYAAPEHHPSLTPEQRDLFDALVPRQEASLAPVAFRTVAGAVKGSRVEGAGAAFDTLLASGALVKVGDDLYQGAQIARIVARVTSHLREHERMTAAEFRDLLGTSRKYAVPLLEWLDARGVTLRSGDHRVLRKRTA